MSMSNSSVPSRPRLRDAVLALEDERQDAHADEVAAVNALERFRDDGLDAEQARALGGPVAAGAGAVLFAGEHDQRHALLPCSCMAAS